MLSNFDTEIKSGKISLSIYFLIIISSLTLSYFLFNWNKTGLAILLLFLPVFGLIILNFKEYQYIAFIASLFLSNYINWDLRIQLLNIILFGIVFYFALNKNTDIYHNYPLPRRLKIAIALFIISVLISSVYSHHRSLKSVYFTTVFLSFMFAAYMFYRGTKDSSDVEKHFKSLIYFLFAAALIIIAEILLTGKIRSTGITGFAIMDIASTTLLLITVRYIILQRPTFIISVIAVANLIILITTLSRFAWLSFVLSFLYSIFIILYTRRIKPDKVKSKINSVIVIILLITGIIFISGLHKIVLKRFSDVSLEVFQGNVEKENVEIASNSLESRLIIWITAYQVFDKNPIFGVGFQMFPLISESYNILPYELYEQYVEFLDAHSTTINYLCETGIAGTSAYYFFLITLFILSFRSIKKAKTRTDISNSIILNAMMFFIIVNGIYSGAYTFGQNAFYAYIIFGISAANYAIVARKEDSE